MNPRRVLFLVALFGVILTGCIQKPDVATESNRDASQYVFYPPLPNPPRFQFLATISDSEDIGKSKGKLFDFVLGEERDKAIPIVKPYGMAIWKNRLFVCDMKLGLHVMDLQSGSFNTWGLDGAGVLSKPVNLAIDRKTGEIFVADIMKKQVLVYGQNGQFLRAYGRLDQLKGPTDVAVTPDRIFICDLKAHQVVVIDRSSAKELYRIGSPGSGNANLYHPSCIEILNDKLYVTDTTNFRVQIFDLEGKSIGRFGSIGRVPGTFSRPKGLAVDNAGRIYVADAAFENIQVFDDQHRLLLGFLQAGNRTGMINLPADITISYDIPVFFRTRVAPGFDVEYLLLVASQFGRNKINVYAFGRYKN